MSQPNILEYLPKVFGEIKEMQAHAQAEYPELTKLLGAAEAAYNDQFLYTMTENGVSRWEKMLGISPMGTDTLEDRRFRIINRLNAQLPYTMRMLQYHLNQMCGATGYTMSYDKDTFTLNVKISLGSKKQYNEVLDIINKMIPMNVLLDYDYLYNTHQTLSQFTHAKLSNYTYSQVKDEPISFN